MNRLIKVATAVIFCSIFIALGSCATRYLDVSDVDEHNERIGERCITTEKLVIHGISRQLKQGRSTDYLVITKPPGSDRPEITFRESLPSGVTLTITGARRCTNCRPSHLEYIIENIGIPEYALLEIAVHEEVFRSAVRNCRKK